MSAPARRQGDVVLSRLDVRLLSVTIFALAVGTFGCGVLAGIWWSLAWAS